MGNASRACRGKAALATQVRYFLSGNCLRCQGSCIMCQHVVCHAIKLESAPLPLPPIITGTLTSVPCHRFSLYLYPFCLLKTKPLIKLTLARKIGHDTRWLSARFCSNCYAAMLCQSCKVSCILFTKTRTSTLPYSSLFRTLIDVDGDLMLLAWDLKSCAAQITWDL